MKYWLIAGVRQEKFVPWLSANVLRLRESGFDTELVVVEGGNVRASWDEAHVLRVEQAGVLPFLHAAMDYVQLRAGPEDWFVRIDADDYYGPRYLEGVANERESGVVGTGIQDPYVRTEDGELYFCRSMGGTLDGAYGGTLAGLVRESPAFRLTGNVPWGEDRQWVQDILAAGKRVSPRTSLDFALCRWDGADHAFPVDGHAIPHLGICEAYPLGEWSEGKVARDFVPEAPPLAFDAVAAVRGMASLSRAARL